MHKQKWMHFPAAALSLFMYLFISYGLGRHETLPLLVAYSLVFAIYCWTYHTAHGKQDIFWLWAALVFRISILFAIPNLSDDFYRFLWDGRLWNAGIHPFAHPPTYYVENPDSGIDVELFRKLNSKTYFTIYPPLTQFIFLISVKLFSSSIYGSLLVMKGIVLLAEAGSILLLLKLAQRFHLKRKTVLLYALNPLVILELTGNVHVEAVMIFFLLLCLYWLSSQQMMLASFAFAGAICTKLLPLLFLPVLINRTGIKKALQFYLTAGVVSLMMFLPLYDPAIVSGWRESIGYYFQKFEFNASIYYLVREWGYWYYGYNIIQKAGWALAAISTAGILLYSFTRKKITSLSTPSAYSLLPVDFMLLLSIFFLFTTTLHPWYSTTLIALSALSRYRYPMVWSFLIFFSYAGYGRDRFEENYLITTLEYLIVTGFFIYEHVWKTQRPSY
jgi:alpha-1,6-mannosyltransferase